MSVNYYNYIQSNKWKNKRQDYYKYQKGKCSGCKTNIDKYFELHHNSYKRLGKEKQGDLKALCELCHRYIHTKDLFLKFKHPIKINKGILHHSNKLRKRIKNTSLQNRIDLVAKWKWIFFYSKKERLIIRKCLPWKTWKKILKNKNPILSSKLSCNDLVLILKKRFK